MNPQYNFEGRVALVTGAASGMGLATARAFAQAGAAVVLADVDEAAVQRAAKDLIDAGHQAVGVVCDVTDEDQAAAMVQSAVDTYGRLDMAFNNAGIQVPPSGAADETAENFDRVNGVNLRGVWAAQKHELRQMRIQGSGAIVNCSSLGGLVGLPERAAYHASKHGVIGLTRSAAVEYAPKGIRINAVCPGVIETPMVAGMLEGQAEAMAAIMSEQPIGRLGRAEEVAAAVLWLCSPGASFVIGGRPARRRRIHHALNAALNRARGTRPGVRYARLQPAEQLVRPAPAFPEQPLHLGTDAPDIAVSRLGQRVRHAPAPLLVLMHSGNHALATFGRRPGSLVAYLAGLPRGRRPKASASTRPPERLHRLPARRQRADRAAPRDARIRRAAGRMGGVAWKAATGQAGKE